MKGGERMNNFSFTYYWCQKVLPLVYDESLSYYEVLCKLCDEMKKLMQEMDDLSEDVTALKKAIADVEKWIADFNTDFIKKLVLEYVAESVKQVYFGLSNTGYFVAYIPKSWNELEFDTIQEGGLYGHLTLKY
jgi:uncharacterized protein Yka (UPF0111/DUF47 family)